MNNFKRLFLLFSLILFTTADDSSEILSQVEADGLLKVMELMILTGYEDRKLDFISTMIENMLDMEEISNVTLIGHQNIMNPDGTIKEIRTVELSIPTFKTTNLLAFKSDSDEDFIDVDDAEQIIEAYNIMKMLSKIGIDMEVGYIEKDGEDHEMAYLNKDMMFIYTGGITYVNKTIVVPNKKMVEEHINSLKERKEPLMLSVLRYDKDGHFLKNNSIVVPELMAPVEEDENEPDGEIIQKIREKLVNLVLEWDNPDEIPARLGEELEKEYKNMGFYVMTEKPTGSYIETEFSVTIAYEFVGLKDSHSYTIYGYQLK